MINKKSFIITGLGFGDEGKGTITDFLARREGAHTVIRHNGGGQAAHNVIDDKGRHHTFAQFGAASFVPGVRTFLSRFMLVDPIAFLEEGRHLQGLGLSDIYRRTTVDPDALIVTPFHAAANQLREIARGAGLHGTCGKGIGETMADSLEPGIDMLRAGDLLDEPTTRRKLAFFRDRKRAEVQALDLSMTTDPADRLLLSQRLWLFDSAPVFDNILALFSAFAREIRIEAAFGRIARQSGTILFEGAQGALLDEAFGFHPHTTWSKTTAANAETLLRDSAYDGEVTKVGVLRAYHTRHGAGPFPTEDSALTKSLPDHHNGESRWQQGFRVGAFDAALARYAIEINRGIDCLALTHTDRILEVSDWRIADGYDLGNVAPENRDLFVPNGRAGHDIRVPRDVDLDRQERLTDAMKSVAPIYRAFRNAPDAGQSLSAYLQAIEAALGAGIRYFSRGATSCDKLEITRRPDGAMAPATNSSKDSRAAVRAA